MIVGDCDRCVALARVLLGCQRLREPEVQHLHGPVRAQLDVRGLQIAVDDALLVRGLERFGDLFRNRQRFVDRDRPARNALRQIVALDQFHHQRANTAGFFEAVDVRDIRMVQGRERLRFAGEPRQPVGVAGEWVRQNLERDVTIEFRVAGAVDLPHPALADLRNDFVDAESSAGCECQVLWIIWGTGRHSARLKGSPSPVAPHRAGRW